MSYEMDFETRIALCDLDERTPAFFVQELFAHGELRVRAEALRALRKGLDPTERTSAMLRQLLRLAD